MNGEGRVQRDDLLFPELSYKIVGALFDVYNKLGNGLREKVYQHALAVALRERHLAFREQVPFDLDFKGVKVGKHYLDFLVEDSVILELKQGDRFKRPNIDQVITYLRSSGKQLAILANFTNDGVVYKRFVNLTPTKNHS